MDAVFTISTGLPINGRSSLGYCKSFCSFKEAQTWMREHSAWTLDYDYVKLEEVRGYHTQHDEIEGEIFGTWLWHPDFGFVPRHLHGDLTSDDVLDFDKAVRIVVGLYRLGIKTGVSYDGSVPYMEGLLLHAPYEWSGRFEPEVYHTLLHEGGYAGVRIVDWHPVRLEDHREP